MDTAQIADVVGDYVTLKRRGANYVACCPFHNEKTPSFYVSPAKGIYKCFGCGKSGSAVGFVMEQEHCSYVEALRYLARKYNIEVIEEEQSAEEIAKRQYNESLLLVMEFAQKFYREQLFTQEGRSLGEAYFRSRGLEDSTVERFGLGWAPSGRTALVDAALAAGYKLEYLLGAGLAVQREDGSVQDKFRERVMFPIHSLSGRIIAYSGRTLRSDNPAKYVNSPETEIYIKSRNLLGIYFAKSEISRLDRCILVEGNIDMVMMHQLGIRNVVASCGTSLTVEQIRLIHKFTSNVTIMYDGDSAGIHAALRGIPMVLAEGMDVQIVLLPDGEDPDSYARSHTLGQVQEYIDSNSRDFITFKSDLLLSEAAGDPLKKAQLINDIADTIAAIPDPVKRSTYVDDTAMKFGVESSLLFRRIQQQRKSRSSEAPLAKSGPEETPAEAWTEENRTLAPSERDLISLLLTYGCDELEFESDSEFYGGENAPKPTVADFIRDALENDGTIMANKAYAATYAAYFEKYDEGLSGDEILKCLMDSVDRQVAEVAASLSTQKYLITIRDFEKSLTTRSSWLVTQVPRAILCYGESIIRDRMEQLKRKIAQSKDDIQLDLMQQMLALQNTQRKIKQKIGREKTKDNG